MQNKDLKGRIKEVIKSATPPDGATILRVEDLIERQDTEVLVDSIGTQTIPSPFVKRTIIIEYLYQDN